MRATTGTRRGAHRGHQSLVSALLPSLLAVAAVSALITALAVWQAEEPSQPPAAAAGRTSPGPDSDPDSSAGSAALVSSAPPATSTPARTGPATPTTTTAPSTTEPATPDPSALRGAREVVVLNQTSRTGLASEVAARLREKGWEVPAVGNFRGVVPATTVYFPDGADEVASVLAADLPTEPRLRPRFGNLSQDRLTVVVTDNYPE